MTQETVPSASQEEASGETNPAGTLISDFQSPELGECNLLFKPPSLWYSSTLIQKSTAICFLRWGRNSLAFQWLGLGTLTVQGLGSIPGWGTKIPQAQWFDQKKEDGEYCSMFIFWNEQSNRGRNYWSSVLGLQRWNENSYNSLLFIGIWVDLLIWWEGWEILFELFCFLGEVISRSYVEKGSGYKLQFEERYEIIFWESGRVNGLERCCQTTGQC